MGDAPEPPGDDGIPGSMRQAERIGALRAQTVPLGWKCLKNTLAGAPALVLDCVETGDCWCAAGPMDDSWAHWWARIRGPAGTPYEDAVFELVLDLRQLIFLPPKVKFITPVFHTNINDSGLVNVDMLFSHWSPALGPLEKLLVSLSSLIADPNPELLCFPNSPLMQSRIRLCVEDRATFDAQARAHTEATALPRVWSCAQHKRCEPAVRARARYLVWVGRSIAKRLGLGAELGDAWLGLVMPLAMARTMMTGGRLDEDVAERCARRQLELEEARRRHDRESNPPASLRGFLDLATLIMGPSAPAGILVSLSRELGVPVPSLRVREAVAALFPLLARLGHRLAFDHLCTVALAARGEAAGGAAASSDAVPSVDQTPTYVGHEQREALASVAADVSEALALLQSVGFVQEIAPGFWRSVDSFQQISARLHHLVASCDALAASLRSDDHPLHAAIRVYEGSGPTYG